MKTKAHSINQNLRKLSFGIPRFFCLCRCQSVHHCIIFLAVFAFSTASYGSKDDEMTDSVKIVKAIAELSKIENPTELYAFEKDPQFKKLILVKHTKKIAALISNSFNDIGEKYRNSGSYQIALFYHALALEVSKLNNDHFSEATTLNNIGVVYRRMDDYKEAMHYHLEALKINDSIGNKHGSAIALNSIGNINFTMGRLEDALHYFKQSLEIETLVGSKLGMAINFNNLGNIYKQRKLYDTALEFYNKSFDMNSQIKSKKGIGICLNDIGTIFSLQGDSKQALNHFLQALTLFHEAGDKRYIADAAFNAGSEYFKINNYSSAIAFIDSSLRISRSIRAKSQINSCLLELSAINKKLGNFAKALELFEQATLYHDSIFNENSQRQISNLQTIYETQKKEQEILTLRNQDQINQLLIKRQELIFSFSLLIVIIVGVGIYIAYRNKKKSEKILFDKNQVIERAGVELQRYAHELELERDKAKASERAKTDFLANMSHEIRTPLNSVLGFADLLETKIEEPTLSNYVNAIRINGRNLLTLINDILDLSKIEAGKMELKFDFVNVEAIFSELSELFSIQAQDKGLVLNTVFHTNLPKGLMLDEVRFRQVLYNLLSNAVKYTEAGEITLSAGFITTGTNEMEPLFYVEVKDTGIGIKNEDLESIFEAFNQGHFQKKFHVGGTGLGLTITKHMVEKMGGKLSVQSEVGKGSSFTIEFVNILSQDLLNQTLNHPQRAKLPDFSGKTFLVVDDLAVNRNLLLGLLEDTNAKMLEAANGVEAIQLMEQQHIDLVLMDIRMPIMDGFEATTRIKQQQRWANIPIIAVTASVMNNDLDRISQNEFNGYIMKPVQMWELYDILGNILN